MLNLHLFLTSPPVLQFQDKQREVRINKYLAHTAANELGVPHFM